MPLSPTTWAEFGLSLSVDLENLSSNDGLWFYWLCLQAYTALAKAFIPAPATEEQRQKIEAFQGHQHELLPSSEAMPKFKATNLCCRSSSKGWFDEVVTKNDQLMNAAVGACLC